MKKAFSILMAILLVSALAITACAEYFTPSVFNPGGPKPSVDPDGNVGVIVDPEGNEIEKVPADAIVITPYSKKDEAEPAVRAALEKAYISMISAGSLKAIVPALGDMTVRDLFHLGASEHICEMLAAGNKLIVNFDMGMGQDEPLEAIAFEDGKWFVCEDACTVLENGDAAVTFGSTGVYSFVVEKG